MNNKARTDDWRVRLAYPLFLTLDALLNTPVIAEPLFAALRRPDRVRAILESIYVNKTAVDDELVNDIICKAGGAGRGGGCKHPRLCRLRLNPRPLQRWTRAR